MKQIALFCAKTIEETVVKINDTESILKQQLEGRKYKEMKKRIHQMRQPQRKYYITKSLRNTTASNTNRHQL